jgi:hypothetical protein
MSTRMRPLTVDMAETKDRMSALELGSVTLVPGSRGSAAPAGTTHFVDGWEAVCGSGRVRFVFPGRGNDLGASCPECVQAVAVPRQRTATRASAATRTAGRAPARPIARPAASRARRAS